MPGDSNSEIHIEHFKILDFFQSSNQSLNLKFVIPQFQREFVWESENIESLIDDLNNANKRGLSNYYLGSIITYPTDNMNEEEVVDGQQRITTLMLLSVSFHKLLKIFKNEISNRDTIPNPNLMQDIGDTLDNLKSLIYNQGNTHAPKLLSRNQDDNDLLIKYFMFNHDDGFVQLDTLLQESSTDDFKNSSFYKNVFKIEEYIKTIIFELKEEEIANIITRNHETGNLKVDIEYNELVEKVNKLLKLIEFVLDKVLIVKVRADNFKTSFEIFEKSNFRGKKLDVDDVLKYMIFKKLLGDRDSYTLQESDLINNKWTEIKKLATSKQKKKSAAFIKFLRYYFIATAKVPVSYSKLFEKVNEFSESFPDVYQNDHNLFIDELKLYAKNYKKMINSKNKNDKYCTSLLFLNKFFDSNKQHYPVVLYAYQLNEEEFDIVTKKLEVLIFYMNFTSLNPNILEDLMLKLLEALHENNIDKFNSKIDEFINTERDSGKSIKEQAMENIVNNSFMENNTTSRGLAKNKTKYILHRVETYLLLLKATNEERKQDILSELDNRYNESDIDHILPKRDSEIQINALDDLDEEMKTNTISAIQRLGNLAILEKELNKNVFKKWGPKEKWKGKSWLYCDVHDYLNYEFNLSHQLNDECPKRNCSKLLKNKRREGFKDSKFLTTKYLVSDPVPGPGVPDRESAVIQEQNFKKVKLYKNKYFTVDTIKKREVELFKIFSKALEIEFVPN